MWFIGVEVEQETSAPPPKKNPGSAPGEGDCILPLLLPLFASATQAIDLWARLVYDSRNGGLFTCC